MLEELYLQDNRLNDIPSEIFSLPNLIILDISNNKLQQMPFDVWKAPKLRELNVAFNLLKDLPTLENVCFGLKKNQKLSVSSMNNFYILIFLTGDNICVNASTFSRLKCRIFKQ